MSSASVRFGTKVYVCARYFLRPGKCFKYMDQRGEEWACDFGTKALEKQIPMKPNNIKSIFDFSGRYYTTKGNCPVCNREGLYKSDFYCNKCGQRLDWEG